MKLKRAQCFLIMRSVWIAALAGAAITAGAATWTGGGSSLNWSDPGNWDAASPPAIGVSAIFDKTIGFTNAAGVVNNVADTDFTFGSLVYSALSSAGNYHTTLIPAGQTLSVTGTRSTVVGTGGYSSTDTLFVGSGAADGASATVYATIAGQGSLVLSNASGNLDITQTTTGGSSSTRATLDLSGLDTFNAYVSQVRVGFGSGGNDTGGNRPSGTLILAKTNVITCASTTWGLAVGQVGSNPGQPSTNLLGQANWIQADYGIGIGRRKCSATLAFTPGLVDPSVVFRNAAGTGPMSYWVIGDNYDAGATGVSLTAIADFTGGIVDAQVANIIYVGRSYNSANGTTTGLATGRLIFDRGVIEVNNLEIGYQQSTSAGRAAGELNTIGSGLLVVTNNIRLGRYSGGDGTATGTLNLGGGRVAVGGRVYDGGGSSALNITGGILDLQPEGDPAPGDIAVDALAISYGTITNAASISAAAFTIGPGAQIAGPTTFIVGSGSTIDASAAGGWALSPAQTLRGEGYVTGDLTVGGGARLVPATEGAAGVLYLNNSLALSGGAVLPFDLTDQAAFGNDQLYVSGNLTLSGVNTIPVNPLMSALSLGSYTLIQYSGALSGNAGNLQLSGPALQSRSTLALDTSTPGQVNLVVSGNTPQLLTWVGDGMNNRWNINGDANWSSGGGPDKFFNLDSVTFDDTGSASPAVELQGELTTPNVVMNNSAKAYTFAGPGAILGAALNLAGGGSLTLANDGESAIPVLMGTGTLVKAGTNTLELAGNNSGFAGAIRVEGGALRTASETALGDTIGATTVAGGGTLDVNGQNLGGELVHASGAGALGRGAIDNTGAQQQSALQSVVLDGDTTFGASVQRWDITTGGTGLAGNGRKLTKVGPQEIWIKTVVDTDLGDIEIAQGRLGFQYLGTTLGRPENTLTIRSNASLGLYSNAGAGSKRIVMDDGALIYAAGGDCQFAGTISLNGANTIAPNGITNYCDADISGPGVLVKDGTGVLQLGGANTFASDIVVNTGTLLVTNPAGLGPGKTIVLAGSTTTGTACPNPGSALRLEGDVTLPAPYALSMSSSATGNIRSLLFTAAGTNELAGPITLHGDGLCQVNVNSAAAQLTLNGDITGAPGFAGTFFVRGGSGVGIINGKMDLGAGGFSKTDNNTWIINSSGNTWSQSGVLVGTIRLGAHDALCTSAPLVMGQSSGGNSTLDLAGFNQEVGGLFNAGSSTQTIGNSSTASDSTLTVSAGAQAFTYDKIIADSVAGGTMKVNLTIASGTQSLTATNTYSGRTTVAGTLRLVGGSLINSSATIAMAGGVLDAAARTDGTLTLASGQTLSGSGTILGAVIASPGSTVAPGASIGELQFGGSLALQGAAVMEIQKSGASLAGDRVDVATSLNYGGSLTVSASGDPLAEGDQFKLFNALVYTGAGFDPVNLPALPEGLGWTNRLALDGTIAVIRTSTVPTEPTPVTWSLSQNALTIAWPASYVGWSLQAQTNTLAVGISTNWTTLSGSDTTNSVTLPIDSGNPAVFYRLVYPAP